jgi:hypothetical protein
MSRQNKLALMRRAGASKIAKVLMNEKRARADIRFFPLSSDVFELKVNTLKSSLPAIYKMTDPEWAVRKAVSKHERL